jgi:hypothetical protein
MMPAMRRRARGFKLSISLSGQAGWGCQGIFERSVPSDLIRGWKPVRMAIKFE